MYMCAFRDCKATEKWCQRDDMLESESEAALPPPTRHALIISRPSRYPLAAAEASRAGFIPKYMPGVFRNWSICYPLGGSWETNRTQYQENVKVGNLLTSFQLALQHIVDTGVPHAILEDDIVLATSRREVQGYLDDVTKTGRRTIKTHVDGVLNYSTRTYARHEFDFVPLGTCGYGEKFACGHAAWVTPAGAKESLKMVKQCTPGDPTTPRASAYIDVDAYYNKVEPARGKVCSTMCSPDRAATPECWDDEAIRVVANRQNDCIGDDCSRAALRCATWKDLKKWSEPRKHPSEITLKQRGLGFNPSRYIGYGHFVQDSLRNKERVVKDEDGNIVSMPTYYNLRGYWHKSMQHHAEPTNKVSMPTQR